MFFRRKSALVRKSPAGTPGRRPTSFRPAVEGLEDRCVPTTTSYSDTLQAWGTGAGVVNSTTLYYDMRGSLAGNLPGSVTSHILYNGVLGRGTDTITGGTLSASVTGSAAGTLTGRLAGGSIVWSTTSTKGTATITITITGGTGAYAGDTGTATFRGTMDRTTQALSGTLTLALTRPTSTPPPPVTSTSTSTVTETLHATGTGAGIAGSNTFFLDTRGTLSGALVGTYSGRIYYTGALGRGTNTITSSGTWSANITGSSSTAGTLQGRITGGSIRWNTTGQSAGVTITYTITGGSGHYSGYTGTAVFQGTMDWTTQALAGTLTLTLKRP